MKKWWFGLLSLVLLLGTAACGGGSQEKTTLRVGATQVPHAEILNHIKPTLEKEGIQLEVRVFQDYVLPNKAVEEGVPGPMRAGPVAGRTEAVVQDSSVLFLALD